MTGQRFPLLRLPDDLRLRVLQTTEHLEIMAFSFTSKKACSMVKSLCLPISLTKVVIKNKHPCNVMKFGPFGFNFLWVMGDNKFEDDMRENYETMANYNGFPENMTNFNDLPTTVKVYKRFEYRVAIFTWSNQGMSLGKWIQHLFSISKPEKRSGADFHVYNSIEFDIPTLRSIFPKLGSIFIFFVHGEAVNEHEKMSAQNFLKAFLPDVKKLRLDRMRLGEHFCIGDFGTTDLKELVMYRPRNLKVEDLRTLNAEKITIGETNADEITLQNLNHFFKLWISGSNPKLKELKIWWYTRTNPDWIVLLKELEADNAGEETAPEDPMVLLAREEGYVWLNEGEAAQNVDVAKKFIIRNSRGFAAQMKCYTRTSSFRNTAHVEFTVSI